MIEQAVDSDITLQLPPRSTKTPKSIWNPSIAVGGPVYLWSLRLQTEPIAKLVRTLAHKYPTPKTSALHLWSSSPPPPSSLFGFQIEKFALPPSAQWQPTAPHVPGSTGLGLSTPRLQKFLHQHCVNALVRNHQRHYNRMYSSARLTLCFKFTRVEAAASWMQGGSGCRL